MELSGRKALVVGLGKSGVAAARLLFAHGAHVAVTDSKGEAQLGPQLEGLRGIAEHAFLGGITAAAFAGRDLVVLSPGVPLAHPEVQAALSLAGRGPEQGMELIGEVELASRFVSAPILGVTGTNGKSTTTALTAHLLSMAGRRAFAGGNLGTPLSEAVLGEMEEPAGLDAGARSGRGRGEARYDALVCELSSFQLETIRTLRCAAACLLNVTPDHLDRYPSLDAYAAAKAHVFENQRPGDRAVLNAADARVRAVTTPRGVSRTFFEPRLASATRDSARRAAGCGEPDAGRVEWPGLSGRRTGPRQLEVEGVRYTLTAPTLRGTHNAENALAALLLARHLDAPPEALQRGLDTYPGLPHRLEPVATIDGVEWLNDSKATNVDSVEKSLSAFEARSGGEGTVLLILGGRGKRAPYSPLLPLLPGRVRAILTIGEDAPAIARELGDACPLLPCGDLLTACARARDMARPGDAVLLSPACASYDQFKNFEERGDRFKAWVLAQGGAP
jgi:UDP-N-acetylmuramoylalanine--D-glutamate ligase